MTRRDRDDRIGTNQLLELRRESDADDRTLRRAVALAAVAHLGLLLVHLPDVGHELRAEPPREKAFVVQSPTFRDRPEPVDTIPEKRARKVPIPDPDPDDPEPIRLVEEEPPEIDLDDLDLVGFVPDAPPPPEDDGPILVTADVDPPVRIHDPSPVYTEAARRAGVEGVVVVQAIIDETGAVTNARILRGLGFGLDESTLRAVSTWRFEPAILRGRPVEVYYTLTVNFGIQ